MGKIGFSMYLSFRSDRWSIFKIMILNLTLYSLNYRVYVASDYNAICEIIKII